MRRQAIASWIVAAATGIATTIARMIWPTIDPTIGFVIFGVCGVLILVGIVLLFWPARASSQPEQGQGAALVRFTGSEGRLINPTISGNKITGRNATLVDNVASVSGGRITDNAVDDLVPRVWPDFRKWDQVDPLQVYEAACLWADTGPVLPWPSVGAEVIFKKLSALYFDHALTISHGTTTIDILREVRATMDAGVVSPHAKVGRSELKRVAVKWNEKPKFLFPHSRA